MDQVDFAAFDRTRDFSQKAVRSLCYAPFVSLYFRYDGQVLVCCYSGHHPVGNAQRDTIDEIWHGARIKAFRETLASYSFGPGCKFCSFQTAEGHFGNAAIRRFDWLALTEDPPLWPQQMEFSISNACNLECVMCCGELSSSIRANRDRLPPLPRMYSDAFLDSLRSYFPHLRSAKFLGGEPFLIAEYYRLWDIMIADGVPVPSHVSTNGTQYHRKVERVLESIPMGFSVSMDGVTKATVESIRVNARHEEVMANARRFRDYARERGTAFSITFCLMRQNWHEFGDFCLMADEWNCPVGINTVVHPPQFGIYTLPVAELRKVLEGMEAQAPRLEGALNKNRAVWFGELDRIRGKCRSEAVAAQ